MSNVIQFPQRVAQHYDQCEIDLLSAVDIAIRDLREISEICHASARDRAYECLSLLEGAYAVATQA